MVAPQNRPINETRDQAALGARLPYHFLADANDRIRYVKVAERSLKPGGHLTIATFAEDSPTRCSGLVVVRYSPKDEIRRYKMFSWRLMVSTGTRPSNVVGCLLWALLSGAQVAAQEPAKESEHPSTQPASARGPIEDNSFLIEEAYNQEAGVVQHISAFTMQRATRAWAYAFTQEWPLFSQRHQISFTLPVVSAGRGTGSGVGDIALHYRYQLADGKRSGVLAAPRLSLLVPSGNVRRDRGAGGAGVQVNLPITVEHSARFVTHWNAGATFTPSARNALGNEATTRSYNVGGSMIWLARSALNVMLEVVGASDEAVSGPGERVPARSLFLSPGVRGAIDFPSGLQIVPGVAVPIGIGPSRGDRKYFLYLSFEHPFSDRSKGSPSP